MPQIGLHWINDDFEIHFVLLLLQHSIDKKSSYVKVHATWEALTTGAELMSMRKRIIMPKVIRCYEAMLEQWYL